MSTIKTIQVNNFKFFGNSKPIELNGQNLLLYGENGSGKSSLSYALYTILEAANKQPEGTKKYFTPLRDNSQSLLNIYVNQSQKPEEIDSFIKIIDTNDTEYKLSYNDTALCGNTDLIESNSASDFITYQSLFHFQLFRNSQKTDLWNVFRSIVLPHLSFSTYTHLGSSLKNAAEIWKVYRDGPEHRKNAKGKDILVYSNSPEYKDYLGLEYHFNDQMRRLIDFVNANINRKIIRFGYAFEVKLEYINARHSKKDTHVDFVYPEILLKMTKYNGVLLNVEHPNIYLNEARMSALAFSILWSVLDYRFNAEVVPNALKVLTLDDVMISLDKANRKILMDIIIEDLAQNFQILFMTHDRSLFEMLKQELKFRYDIKDDGFESIGWKLMDMYAVSNEGKEYPRVQTTDSHYSKARRYFNGDNCPVDYNAAGNELRQAIEGAFKEIFDKCGSKNEDGSSIDLEKLMLGNCIEIAKQEFPRLGMSNRSLSLLNSIKSFVLNSASHDNPQVNFYRQELLIAFEVYEELSQFECKIIIAKGQRVSFALQLTSGEVVEYRIELKKSIKAYKFSDSEKFSIHWANVKFNFTVTNEPEGKVHSENRMSIMNFYDDSVRYWVNKDKFDESNKQDILDAITLDGRTLRVICDES